MASVGFDATVYTVDEGGMVQVCVEVVSTSHDNCLVTFPFNISFTTGDDSAGNLLHYTVHTIPYVRIII